MDEKMTVMDVEKLLADVHPDEAFVLKDGSAIKNLRELYSALQGMESRVFEHHVNGERNDFGNWIKDVHKDYRLANSLFSSTSREDAVSAIGGRIYEIEKKLKPEKKVVASPHGRDDSCSMVIRPGSQGKRKSETGKFMIDKDCRSGSAGTFAGRPKPGPVVTEDGGRIVIRDREELEKRIAVKSCIEDRVNGGIVSRHSKAGLSAPAAGSHVESRRIPDKEDACEELIRFAEDKSFAGRFISEVASIFTRPDLKSFAGEMRKVISWDDEGDGSDDGGDGDSGGDDSSVPSGPDVLESMKASGVDESKKQEIMSYLKRVYR